MKKRSGLIYILVFSVLALYILAVFGIPHLTLAVDASATWTSIYNHFVDVKTAIAGDEYFILVVVGLLAALYYVMIYKPKKIGKGKKAQNISMTKKVVFVAAAVYGLLLIAIPFITVAVDAQAWLITFTDHFVSVKNAAMTDIAILILATSLIGSGYYFMVYKNKLVK